MMTFVNEILGPIIVIISLTTMGVVMLGMFFCSLMEAYSFFKE